MELEERLSYLENVRDWQTFVEELEKGIVSSAQNADKAQFHLKLGRVLETKFLAGVKALKHFQDAYKLNPALIESLESARSVYWGLGKLNMVQKLLELELKAGGDGAARERAARRAGRRALRSGRLGKGGGDVRARPRRQRRQEPRGERLPRGRAGRGRERPRSTSRPLSRAANDASDGAAKARALPARRRASRGASRPTTPKGCSRAPTRRTRVDKQVAALYEGLLAEQGRFDALEQAQNQALQQAPGRQGARRRSRSPSGRAGCSGTRTSKWARSSSRRRCGSTRRTRARSISCARPTARRRATGTACSTSPKKPRRASRTATARSCSRRRARSRGGSSAT